jgi:hypothetical protein
MCELIFSAFPCRLIARIEFANDTQELELVQSQLGAVLQQIQLQQIMSVQQLKPKSGMQVDIRPYKAI